ncbi:MAG: CBS domain-containing protein [Myxococcales bacterium]|jgi:predicted transcriptional regulator
MRVSDIMTRDLVALPRDETVASALRRAAERDLHHVLIVDGSALAGIACICDLRELPTDTKLGDCIARPPEVIEPERSLDEAAEQFVARSVSCFPVCNDGELVGVVTRSDLRRSKLPEFQLPSSFECAFCGSTRHVRPAEHDPSLATCLECADRSVPASARQFDVGTKD